MSDQGTRADDRTRTYEMMYILKPGLGEEEYEEKIKQVTALVKGEGGIIGETDRWGIRPLTYEIDHHPKGYYVVLHFDFLPDRIVNLEERLNIDDEVLRYQIVRESEST
ncbi:MAG: 30S ribosomal protein S6 [Candidatus Bipolaricaulia bacterium]